MIGKWLIYMLKRRFKDPSFGTEVMKQTRQPFQNIQEWQRLFTNIQDEIGKNVFVAGDICRRRIYLYWHSWWLSFGFSSLFFDFLRKGKKLQRLYLL
jgi:hypothetical protein